LKSWLDQIERATGVPADEPHRILYFIDPQEHLGVRRTRVRAAKARQLLAGGYGKPQDFNLLGHSKASFIGPDDQRIMGLLAVARGGGEPECRLSGYADGCGCHGGDHAHRARSSAHDRRPGPA
jgi:hypothetical protein